MRAKDIVVGNTYLLKANTPYLYANYENIDIIFYTNKDKIVKVTDLVDGISVGGINFNLEIEVKGNIYPYRFHINSYYLVEYKSTNTFKEDDYEYLMKEESDFNNDELDCIEIHKGKAIFNKKERTKEEIYQEFNLHSWYEHNLINKEINNDWDKELILMEKDLVIMQSDVALDKKDKAEFKLLSKKLREIKER